MNLWEINWMQKYVIGGIKIDERMINKLIEINENMNIWIN